MAGTANVVNAVGDLKSSVTALTLPSMNTDLTYVNWRSAAVTKIEAFCEGAIKDEAEREEFEALLQERNTDTVVPAGAASANKKLKAAIFELVTQLKTDSNEIIGKLSGACVDANYKNGVVALRTLDKHFLRIAEQIEGSNMISFAKMEIKSWKDGPKFITEMASAARFGKVSTENHIMLFKERVINVHEYKHLIHAFQKDPIDIQKTKFDDLCSDIVIEHARLQKRELERSAQATANNAARAAAFKGKDEMKGKGDPTVRNYRRDPCWWHFEKGSCKNGKNCNWSHEAPPGKGPQAHKGPGKGRLNAFEEARCVCEFVNTAFECDFCMSKYEVKENISDPNVIKKICYYEKNPCPVENKNMLKIEAKKGGTRSTRVNRSENPTAGTRNCEAEGFSSSFVKNHVKKNKAIETSTDINLSGPRFFPKFYEKGEKYSSFKKEKSDFEKNKSVRKAYTPKKKFQRTGKKNTKNIEIFHFFNTGKKEMKDKNENIFNFFNDPCQPNLRDFEKYHSNNRDHTVITVVGDTGASDHNLNLGAKEVERLNIKKVSAEPTSIETGNGIIRSPPYKLQCYNPFLGEEISSLNIQNAPNICAIGKLIEGGWKFVWESLTEPTLIDPKGDQCRLELENYVPIFKTSIFKNTIKTHQFSCVSKDSLTSSMLEPCAEVRESERSLRLKKVELQLAQLKEERRKAKIIEKLEQLLYLHKCVRATIH